MIKRLEHMRETFMTCVEGELCNIEQADAKELGEVVDMIKDIEEAIYYHTITKAMNEPAHQIERKDEPYKHRVYYGGDYGTDHATGGNMQHISSTTRGSHDPMMKKDSMEGRSPMYRKAYMEGKKMHGEDSAKNAKELEDYIHELTQDIMEMIEDASVEEKQMLRQKISLLANKIK